MLVLCESFACCLSVEVLELADKLCCVAAAAAAAVAEHTCPPFVVKKTLLRRFTLEPYWLQPPERVALVVLVRW